MAGIKYAFIALSIISAPAFSQSTWTGDTSNSMNDGSNWAPPGVPSSETALNFPPNASLFSPNNDIGVFLLAPITTNTTYSISLTTPTTGPYILSGSPFQVPSAMTALLNIGGPGSGPPNNISSQIQSAIELNSGTLNILGGHFDALSGVISGVGTINIVGGSLSFQGVNTYSGPTNINTGILQMGINSSLPSTTNVSLQSGAILDLNNTSQSVSNVMGTSGSVIVTGSGSLAITNTGANTFSGTINLTANPPATGSGGSLILNPASTGSFTVAGANSYSSAVNIGSTIVNGGTLIAGNTTAFGTNSNLSIASGAVVNAGSYPLILNQLSGAGALQITNNVTVNQGGTTFSGNITGSGGSFTYSSAKPQINPGVLILSGSNSYAGATVLYGGGTLQVSSSSLPSASSVMFQNEGGVLQLGSAGSFPNSIVLSTGGALDLNGFSPTWSGNISGGGSFTIQDSGAASTLSLSGSNNYTGGTSIQGGTVSLQSGSSFPNSGPLTIASGGTLDVESYAISVSTLQGSGTLNLGSGSITVNGGVSGSESIFSGVISSTPTSQGLRFAGNGSTLLLSGANTYYGPTTINGSGTLSVTQSGLSSNTTGIVFSGSGGTLQTASAVTSGVPITLDGVGASIDTENFSSVLSGAISSTGGGSSSLDKLGVGTLTLSGLNTYNGSTNVFAGTLTAGSSNALGNTSSIDVFPDATLDLNNFSISIQQLEGDPLAQVELGTATLTLTDGIDTSPFYGVVSGSGNLAISGGSPAFLGTNTFTGSTTVEGNATLNTLSLGSSSALIFGPGGGVLQMGSDSSSSASLAINDVATISTNTYNLSLSGAISGTGSSFTKIGAGTLTLTGSNSYTNNLFLEGGTLAVSASSLGTPASFTFQQFCGTLASSSAITASFPITVTTQGIFDTTGGNISLSGSISGGSGIVKTGTGTLTLQGTNSYQGITTILNGTLNALASALPTAPMLVFDTAIAGSHTNGVFQAAGNFSSFPSVVFLDDGTIDTNGFSIAEGNVVAGGASSTFTKTGSGALILSAQNIYKGPTQITSGILQAGASATTPATGGAFGLHSDVTIASGGELNLNGFNNPIGSLTGVSGSLVSLGSGTLTIENGNGLTFAGNITDSGDGGSLTLASGTLTLEGTNAFSGTTTIATGATLQFQGSTNNLGDLITLGSLFTDVLISSSGSYSQADGASLQVDFTTPSSFGQIIASGDVSLASGGTLTISNSGHVTPSGVLTLLQGSSLTGQLQLSSNAFSKATLQYTPTQLNLIFTSSGCQGAWNSTTSGNWGVTANWNPNTCYPGTDPAIDEDTASFPDVTGAPASLTISLGDSSSSPLPPLTLYSLNFTAANSNYSIVEASSGTTNIILDGAPNSTPSIAISAGSHTIDVPLLINQNSSFILTSGNLILGSNATLSSTGSSILTIEGSSGTLTNHATIQPFSINMQGGIFTNDGQVAPSSIFTFTAGTINNVSGSTFGLSTTPLTISGGNFINQTGAAVQASTLTLSGGTLTTQTPIHVNQYSQSSGANLVLDFPSLGSYGEIVAVSSLDLGGNLTLTNSGSVVAPSSGTLPLLSGSSLGGATFASVDTTIFPSAQLKYSGVQVYLDFNQTFTCNGIWKSPSSGNWGALANWKTCVPGITQSINDTATFSSILGGSPSLTVLLEDTTGNPLDVVLNQISFTSGTISYTISQTGSSQGSITLDGTSDASISVSAGTHTINAPIVLKNDAAISFSNGTLNLGASADITSFGGVSPVLTINGGISGILNQSATMTPDSIQMTGGIFNNFGTLQPANSISVSGGLLSNRQTSTIETGTLSVSSGGTFATQDLVSLQSYNQLGGTLTLDFPSLSPYGHLSATGAVNIGGILNITNSGSVPPTGIVTLIQGSSLSGSFSSIQNAFAATSVLHTSYSSSRVYLNFEGCYGIWESTSPTDNYWGLASNWNSGTCYPGANSAADEDTATFINLSPFPPTITVILANSTGTSALNLPNLYQLNLNSEKTSYQIVQFSGGGSITMNAGEGPALIQQMLGNHTIDVPIHLGIDTEISLASGSVTFGSAATVDGAFTLTVSGSNGTWINSAATSPQDLSVIGGTVSNFGSLLPIDSMVIQSAIDTTATVNNFNTVTSNTLEISAIGATQVNNFAAWNASGTMTIGQTGVPTLFNSDLLSSGGDLTIQNGLLINTVGGQIFSSGGSVFINDGTIANSLLASIYAEPNHSMTISGGVISNQTLGVLGSHAYTSLAETLTVSGGQLDNQGYVLANSVNLSGGVVNNLFGGAIFASAGGMTVSGSQVTNAAGTSFGASSSDLLFSQGTIVNQGAILANHYTQTGGSQLTLGVLNVNQFGFIEAQGAANLGGSLIVEALPGFSMTSGQSIDLITAIQGLHGTTYDTFSFQNFPSSLIPSLLYLPNALALRLTAANPAHFQGSTSLTFTAIGQHNQVILRKCEQLSLRLSQMQKQKATPIASASMDESQLIASNSMAFFGAAPQIQRKQEQLSLREERKGEPWSVYAGPIASCGTVESKGEQIGFGYYTVGALAGFDYCLLDDPAKPFEVGIGALFDYRKKFGHASDHWGTFTLQKLHTSVYSTLTPKRIPEFMLNAIGGFAYSWDDLHRKTGTDKESTAVGKPTQAIFDLLFDVEYQFSSNTYSSMPKNLRCVPFANVQYIYDHVSGYTEHGAGIFDLKVAPGTPKSLTTMLGGRLTYEYSSKNYTLFAEIDGGWQREYLSRSRRVKYTPFELTSTPAYTTAYLGGANSFLLGIDLISTLYDAIQVETSCDFKWNSLFFDASFYLGLGKDF